MSTTGLRKEHRVRTCQPFIRTKFRCNRMPLTYDRVAIRVITCPFKLVLLITQARNGGIERTTPQNDGEN